MISRIKGWLFRKKYLIAMLREDNVRLKDQMINKRKLMKAMSKNIVDICNDLNLLQDKIVLLREKKDRASKKVAEQVGIRKQLEKRRDEVLRRLKGKIPDEVIGGRLENYKYWIAEPFIVDDYIQHLKVDDKTTFVDSFAAYRGISKVIDDEQEGKSEDT